MAEIRRPGFSENWGRRGRNVDFPVEFGAGWRWSGGPVIKGRGVPNYRDAPKS